MSIVYSLYLVMICHDICPGASQDQIKLQGTLKQFPPGAALKNECMFVMYEI